MKNDNNYSLTGYNIINYNDFFKYLSRIKVVYFIYLSLFTSWLTSLSVPKIVNWVYYISLINFITYLIVLFLSWFLLKIIIPSVFIKLSSFITLAILSLPATVLCVAFMWHQFRFTSFLSDIPTVVVIPIYAIFLLLIAALIPRLFLLVLSLKARWLNYLFVFFLIINVVYNLSCIQLPKSPSHEIKLPTVVLIIVDTARADLMDVTDSQCTTYLPNFRKFAEHSIICANALAPSSWTLPSHAVLFTGNAFYSGTERFIADESITIAEMYKKYGYTTIGISANRNLRIDNGFGQGFDLYLTMRSDMYFEYNPIAFFYRRFFNKDLLYVIFPSSNSVSKVVHRFLSLSDDKTLFLFINYMDAHEPYFPSSKALLHYQGIEQDDVRLGRLAKPGKGAEYFFKNEAKNLTNYEIGKMRKLYQACLSDWDEGFKSLMYDLKNREKLGHQLTVVTSDHGELFGEYGRFFMHRNQLFLNELRIPLVIGGSVISEENRGVIFNDYISLCQVNKFLLDMLQFEEKYKEQTSALDILQQTVARDISEDRFYLIYEMGPTLYLQHLEDERSRFADERLINVYFPYSGAELLFYDNGTKHYWRTKPADMDEESLIEIVSSVLDTVHYYFEYSPIVKEQSETEMSPEEIEAFRALGYIK